MKLAGKRALVTGAGAAGDGIGNGRAICILLARQGVNVVAVDRDVAAAERTASMIAAEGGECRALEGDVAVNRDVEGIVAQLTSSETPIDILVNNVGIAALGGPVELEEADWDRVMAVNVKSMFLTTKHVLPHMVRHKGGAIVNVSSIASIRWGPPPLLCYSVSKAAVNALTQNVALEYARFGVRCNAVLPGLINTPMIREPLLAANINADRHIETRGQLSPTGKMGTGWDVGAAVAFLASDDASYINGTLLPVDGGLSLQVSAPPAAAGAA